MHTTGGYLTAVTSTTRTVFDLREDDVFWCTADVGWVTGHSYLVYGPLANGATCVMYEGAPDWPEKDRFWDLIAKHRRHDPLHRAHRHPRVHEVGRPVAREARPLALRLLGSVGEPINPEAWMWYREHIGGETCPIVDTWWQTETGSIVISPLPGITATKPGSATRPLPGCSADLLDSNARSISRRRRAARAHEAVAVDAPHDLGRRRALRADVLLQVAGPTRSLLSGRRRQARRGRLLLDPRPRRRRAERRRPPHRDHGSRIGARRASGRGRSGGGRQGARAQGPGARRVRDPARNPSESPELAAELKQFVAEKIGAIARPDDILFSADLPKTRSGKIMRRLLRDIAEGRALGDTTTLADPAVVEGLKEQYESLES